jgi:hypothetical protein
VFCRGGGGGEFPLQAIANECRPGICNVYAFELHLFKSLKYDQVEHFRHLGCACARARRNKGMRGHINLK